MPGTLVDIDNVRKALNEYEAATDTDPKRKSLSEKGGFSRDPFTEIITKVKVSRQIDDDDGPIEIAENAHVNSGAIGWLLRRVT